MFKFNNIDTRTTLVPLLLTLIIFHTFFLLTLNREMFAGNTLLFFLTKKFEKLIFNTRAKVENKRINLLLIMRGSFGMGKSYQIISTLSILNSLMHIPRWSDTP